MNRFLRAATLVFFAVHGVMALAAPPPLTCPTISLAPTSLPNGDLATAYTPTVTASGSAAAVVIDITHGVLPSGVTLTDMGTGTATFSGTSTQTGTFEFTITATDANGCSGGRTYAPTFAAATSTTTLALTAGPNPSVFGQSLTFTATVTSGSGTPAGNVTFKDGAATLGTVALNGSGQATFTTSTLTVGTHSPITAVYAGNASFAGSTSNALSQTVTQAATTTTLVSGTNPSVFGQSVTFTATVAAVAPGAGTPTGTVTFFDGVTSIGTGALNGSGVATFSTSTLTVGNHSISATYGADTNFSGSTSSVLTQTINQAATATAVASVTNPSVFGQSATFTAAVTAVAPGAGTPTGTVTFKDGATTLGSGTLNGSGVATFTTSTLTVAVHSITATYNADTNFTGSTSSTLTQTVNQAATSTALASSPNPSAANQSVTFTATVTATAPGAGTPTGTATFFDGATNLGSGALAAGVATFTTSTLTVGSHSITATYSGDTNFTTSTSAPLTQTVNLAPSTTTLTSSTNPTVFGQSTTFTATVTGTGTPTGTVAFMDGAALLGTSPLVAGVATFSTGTLAVGTHTITAVYSGDSNFAASTSAPLTQTVNQAATTTTVTSGTNPSVFGQSVTLTATVAAVAPGAGTPTGTVTFKDGVTVLGAPVTLNGSGQATFTSSAFSVGAHQITATYSADTNFLASDNTASPLVQTVNQAATTTTVVSGTNPSVFGQSVTFTATVTPVAPGAGTPTGTVQFKDGAVNLGAPASLAGGVATFTTSSLSVSTHSITAIYNADTNFTGSTSSALSQTVNQAATTTAVVSSQNPSVTGQSVTFTATVTATAPGAGTPTGTVTFKDGAATLGSGALAGGVATFTTTTLGVGAHSITAVYGGDVNFTGSISGALTQNVNQPPAITSANNTTFAPGKTGQTFTVNTTGFPTGASMVISQSGTVPSAVTFTNNNDGTATIAGTPAAGTQGSSPYAWTITANNGVAPTANQSFTFNVVCPAITVSGAIPALTFNTAMTSTTFTQVGGNGAIAWTAAGLPAGVSINAGTGAVTGTPTVTGTFSATITATDAGGCTGTNSPSVTVAPVATADAESGLIDNTQFVLTGGTTGSPATPFVGAAGSLITNDFPAGGVTATAGTVATTAGGSVTIAADGTFIYTPKANPTLAATTSDSFTYTISSNTGGTPTPTTANGTVTLTLAGRVWYIKNNGAAGNGQSQSTFNTLSAGIAASTANDIIYIYTGDGTTANLATASILKAGQKLIGQGVAFPIAGVTNAPAAGGFPIIGNTITLATNVTVNGIDMTTGAANGIVGTSVTGLNVTPRNVTTTTGTAVNIGGAGNSGTFLFRSISANGAVNGILLANTAGTFTVTGDGSTAGSGGTIQNSTGNAINMTNTGVVSLSWMVIKNSTHLGINGLTLGGFTLVNSSVLNNGTTANVDKGINLLDVSGNATFTSDTVNGNHSTNLFFGSSIGSSTITNSLTITNGTYNNSVDNSGIQIIYTDTSKLKTATITGVTASTNFSTALQVQSNGASIVGDGVGAPATGTVTVSNGTFTNNGAASIDIDQGGANGAGQMYARLLNNASLCSGSGVCQGMNVFDSSSATGGTMKVHMESNTVGNAAMAGSGSTGGPGIRVFLQGKTTNTITMINNTVRQTLGSRAIDIEALGPVTTGQPITVSDIVIAGNNAQTNDPNFSLGAIYVAADNQGSPAQINAEIHGNTVPTGGCFDYPTFDGNAPWIYYRIQTSGAVAKLFNFGGHANANAEIAATQTSGTAGADIANFGGVQLTATPVNAIP